jgi:hypothetical protein
MDPRKIVVTAGLVTFTLSSVPYIPPPQPSSNVTFTLSRGKFTVIESDKRKKGGEPAHSHLLHAVGTFFATDSSTVIGGIAVADNTEFVAGAVSDRISNDLTFLLRQPISLPIFSCCDRRTRASFFTAVWRDLKFW